MLTVIRYTRCLVVLEVIVSNPVLKLALLLSSRLELPEQHAYLLPTGRTVNLPTLPPLRISQYTLSCT